MPKKPLKPCKSPMCPKLTKGSYCEVHKDREENSKAERNKHYDTHKRDKKANAFYQSTEWERVRSQVLSRDKGLCLECIRNKRITFADVVDHIIPIKVAWDRRLDNTNLQSLCHACHNKKTARDRKG